MIITIDGPAGAGKSTVAKALARRLGFEYLDTGAMYRAVALAGMRRGLDWSRPEDLAQLASRVELRFVGDRLLLDAEDVTDEIRSPQVTALTRFAADNPEVRGRLVELQRKAAERRDIVTEGRDQGSVVFPQAQCKIYLTASAEERARRRSADFAAQRAEATYETVLGDILRRDREDSGRPVGPLVAAPDAIEIATDGLTVDQVVDRIETIVHQRSTQC